MMRRAARVDANQDAIVSALRAAGCYVWILGLPVDLLVGRGKQTWLIEVKRDTKARHTKLQKDFIQNWTGGQFFTVYGPEDALRAIGATR
jgi:hypothetical protein